MVSKNLELVKEEKGTTYVSAPVDDLSGVEKMGMRKAKGVLLQAFVNCQTEQLDAHKSIKAKKIQAKAIRKQIAASAAGQKLKDVNGDISDAYETLDRNGTKMENIIELAREMGIDTTKDFRFLEIGEGE